MRVSRWHSWFWRGNEARTGDGGRRGARAHGRRYRAAAASAGGRRDPFRAQLRRAAAADPAYAFDPRASQAFAAYRGGPRRRASTAFQARLFADPRDARAGPALEPRSRASPRGRARLRLRDRERIAGA